MNTAILTIAAMLMGGSASMAVAQGTSKATIGATPSGSNQQSGTSQPGATPSGPTVPTIVPGPDYSHGSANVGNGSESNGILGSHGARGDKNAQGGYTGNPYRNP